MTMAKPEQVIFLNLGRMIFDQELTVEDANKFLDSLDGYPATARFQTSENVVDKKSGRISVHYFSWKNGDWVDSTLERQKAIRKVITNE